MDTSQNQPGNVDSDLRGEVRQQIHDLLDRGGDALDINAEISNEGGANFIINVPKHETDLIDSAAGIASLLTQLVV